MDTSFSLAVTGQGVLQVGRGMAVASLAKQGKSFDSLSAADQVRAINGWNVAMEMPSGTPSGILAQHQSAVMHAAHNGDFGKLTDAAQARVIGHFKALDSITTLSGIANTQRLQTGMSPRALHDYTHLCPHKSITIDWQRLDIEIPTLESFGAPKLGRAASTNVPKVGLSERSERKPILWYQQASSVNWNQAGIVDNLDAMLDRGIMEAMYMAFQDLVYIGDAANVFPSIFDLGVLNKPAGSLTGSGAMTVQAVTDACIQAVGSAHAAGRGAVVPNRVGIGGRLANFLQGVYVSGDPKTGLAHLREALTNYGYADADIKILWGLDQPQDGDTAALTRFAVTFADTDERGNGIGVLAPPEPLVLPYTDQLAACRLYAWPVGGTHARHRSAVASVSFTANDIQAS